MRPRTRVALLWAADDASERWVFRKVVQTGAIAIARQRGAAKATIPVTFSLEQPSGGAKPWMAIVKGEVFDHLIGDAQETPNMTDTVQPSLVVDFGDERGEFKAHDRANQAVLVKYVDDLFARRIRSRQGSRRTVPRHGPTGGHRRVRRVPPPERTRRRLHPKALRRTRRLLEGRNAPPFRVVVALVRHFLSDIWRPVIEGRLVLAGHPEVERDVRGGLELFGGLPLRSVLMATYAVLSEGKNPDQQADLDEALGFDMGDDEDDEQDQEDEIAERLRRRQLLLSLDDGNVKIT